jgi:hypothetical protein
MTDLAPLCRGLPECVGRRQTDREFMIDRGVPAERADVIIAARRRLTAETGHALPPMAREPDPGRLF